VSRCAATPLIVALSAGHSDTTRFRPRSPIAPDRKSFGWRLREKKKKSKSCSDDRLASLTFLISVQTFRYPLRRELPHVQIFMKDGPNPITWDAQSLSYWFSRNPAIFQDYLVNLINNFWDGHCFGTSRTKRITGGKSPRLNCATQFLTVAYDGACYPSISEWRAFPSAPCLAGKNLMTARVSMLLKSRASSDMLPFSLRNKKRLAIRHMNRPLFPTTLSIPPYDIGK